MTTSPSAETVIDFKVRGGNREFWRARDREILVEGPAGTGKTRTILELLNDLCIHFPGMRALIVRKHQVTLTTTCLVTFNTKVIHNGDGVKFFGGSKDEPAAYQYANGSRIVVGGMDNPDKVLSSEYDFIYANEATELSLEEWETLTSRLRNGVLEHMRIVADCNPASEKHWLNRRCTDGKTRRIRTFLEDNPALFYEDRTLTALGQTYVATLDALSGTRYQRLRLGLWVGVENAIYSNFDRGLHIRPLEPGLHFVDGAEGVDYGGSHKCGVVAVSVDQFNRKWVRRARGEPDKDQGKTLNLMIAQDKVSFQIRRGRTDPLQKYLAGQHGFSVANGSDGSRQHRIDLTERLWNIFPGGRVPYFREERNLRVPQGPFAEPDSPGLLLVEGAEGIEELADEIEGYHYVPVSTDTMEKLVVARINEDLIAGLEDAIEELEEGTSGAMPTSAKREGSQRRAPVQTGWRSA